jgi:hypothetical protein
MGFSMYDISSAERRALQPCVPRSAQHSHKPGLVIDFGSCFEPLSLAVDAATMLFLPAGAVRSLVHGLSRRGLYEGPPGPCLI